MIRYLIIAGLILWLAISYSENYHEGKAHQEQIAQLKQKLKDVELTQGRAFWFGDDDRTICRVKLYNDSNGAVYDYKIIKE